MSNRKLTPIEEEVFKIAEAKQRFSMMVTFNQLVEELLITDEYIALQPDGEEKTRNMRKQEEAWKLVLSEEICGKITYVEPPPKDGGIDE